MVGGTEPDEFAEHLSEVREGLADYRELYAREGLEITGVELDLTIRPFPDILIFLRHERIPGERVLRQSLASGGKLIGSSDAAFGLMHVVEEYPWPALADLPLARSHEPGAR